MKRLLCLVVCLTANSAFAQEYVISSAGSTQVVSYASPVQTVQSYPVAYQQPVQYAQSQPVQLHYANQTSQPIQRSEPVRVAYQEPLRDLLRPVSHQEPLRDTFDRNSLPEQIYGPGRGPGGHNHGPGQCNDRGCNDERCCRCKPVFLQCCYGNGTFILRCDNGGHATYRYDGCVCDAELVKFHQDYAFAYYQEKGTNIRWAFSRDNTWQRSIWIDCKDNPLAGDWKYFCAADSRTSNCR